MNKSFITINTLAALTFVLPAHGMFSRALACNQFALRNAAGAMQSNIQTMQPHARHRVYCERQHGTKHIKHILKSMKTKRKKLISLYWPILQKYEPFEDKECQNIYRWGIACLLMSPLVFGVDPLSPAVIPIDTTAAIVVIKLFNCFFRMEKKSKDLGLTQLDSEIRNISDRIYFFNEEIRMSKAYKGHKIRHKKGKGRKSKAECAKE